MSWFYIVLSLQFLSYFHCFTRLMDFSHFLMSSALVAKHNPIIFGKLFITSLRICSIGTIHPSSMHSLSFFLKLVRRTPPGPFHEAGSFWMLLCRCWSNSSSCLLALLKHVLSAWQAFPRLSTSLYYLGTATEFFCLCL